MAAVKKKVVVVGAVPGVQPVTFAKRNDVNTRVIRQKLVEVFPQLREDSQFYEMDSAVEAVEEGILAVLGDEDEAESTIKEEIAQIFDTINGDTNVPEHRLAEIAIQVLKQKYSIS